MHSAACQEGACRRIGFRRPNSRPPKPHTAQYVGRASGEVAISLGLRAGEDERSERRLLFSPRKGVSQVPAGGGAASARPTGGIAWRGDCCLCCQLLVGSGLFLFVAASPPHARATLCTFGEKTLSSSSATLKSARVYRRRVRWQGGKATALSVCFLSRAEAERRVLRGVLPQEMQARLLTRLSLSGKALGLSALFFLLHLGLGPRGAEATASMAAQQTGLPLWATKVLAAALLAAVSVGGVSLPFYIHAKARQSLRHEALEPSRVCHARLATALVVLNCFACGERERERCCVSFSSVKTMVLRCSRERLRGVRRLLQGRFSDWDFCISCRKRWLSWRRLASSWKWGERRMHTSTTSPTRSQPRAFLSCSRRSSSAEKATIRVRLKETPLCAWQVQTRSSCVKKSAFACMHACMHA